MRLHSDTSVMLLDDTTSLLGYELRRFAEVTSSAFQTRETQAECDARKRAEIRRQNGSAGPQAPPGRNSATPAAGRRPRGFNLNTIKLHFLGDYASSIKKVGSTDSYTTQIVRSSVPQNGYVSCDADDCNLS